MKYTILGFQQSKLIEAKLDVTDALILRMIKDLYSTSSMEFIVEDDTKYMWINYSYFLKQLPILGSKRNLMRRIETYGNDLYILRVLKHSKKGVKGNFSYIAPTKKLDDMQDFDLMTETHKGYDENGIRVETETHNKDSSGLYPSNLNNKHSFADMDLTIARIRKELPKDMTKTSKIAHDKLPKLIKEHGEDELIKSIKNYIQQIKKDRVKFPEKNYMNESTFWNGRYIDYMSLDLQQDNNFIPLIWDDEVDNE